MLRHGAVLISDFHSSNDQHSGFFIRLKLILIRYPCMQVKIPAFFAIAFLSLLSDSVAAGNDSPPEVRSRSSGEVEVLMPGGCVALYDKSGGLITRGSSCSASDRRRADESAASYLREQGVSVNSHSVGQNHEIPPATSNDFADGLAGGPDFWEVIELAPGDALNLRSKPSAKASVVVGLLSGTVLRNHGCKMQGGQRWCQVSMRDDPSRRGWVAGRYLRESSQQ
jgi:hypothetical protein